MRKINLKNFKVATSLTARDINRRIILNVIRMRQPISRADVARLTGLQRSTVSLIADQLIAEGWVVEGEFGRLPRGRRPIFLQLNAERAGVVGINIRPTGTTVGLANLNGQFVAQETIPTNRDPDIFIKDLCQTVKNFLKNHNDLTFEGIGVSVPGRVNLDTNLLSRAPNLGWEDLDIKTALEKATKLSVEIDNAANACALAENYFGEHTDGIDNLIAVTVSEGIGTGIIANGQLVRGPSGLAGEFGHVSLEAEGQLCRCGNRGCWEVLASNNAALRYYQESLGNSNSSNEISFTDLLALYHDGDPGAVGAVERMAVNLGLGLAMLVNGFEPSLIVMIGEITTAWDRVGPIIEKSLQDHHPLSATTKIVPIDDALQPRLRGTVALVLEKHLGAPSVA